MGAVDDLDEVIGRYDRALGEVVRGNAEPVKELFSHGDDVTLANPLFPVGRGWAQVAERMEQAASNLRNRRRGGRRRGRGEVRNPRARLRRAGGADQG